MVEHPFFNLPEPEPDVPHYSIVVWPADAGLCLGNTANESRDKHRSESAAQAVCDGLERIGFGGEGKVFPVSTRIEPVSP